MYLYSLRSFILIESWIVSVVGYFFMFYLISNFSEGTYSIIISIRNYHLLHFKKNKKITMVITLTDIIVIAFTAVDTDTVHCKKQYFHINIHFFFEIKIITFKALMKDPFSFLHLRSSLSY